MKLGKWGTLGVVFRESFRGSYHRIDEALVERAADLHLVVFMNQFRRFVREQDAARVSGSLSIEGLVDRVEVIGTVRFRLRTEKRISYDLSFKAGDGVVYRLRAQREPHPVSPLEVITNLRFSIYDENEHEIGRGLARCDIRTDLKAAVGSLRLRLAAPTDAGDAAR